MSAERAWPAGPVAWGRRRGRSGGCRRARSPAPKVSWRRRPASLETDRMSCYESKGGFMGSASLAGMTSVE